MADPRGFKDTLEPARQRSQWQFDAALAQVAALRVQVTSVRSELATLEHQAMVQARHATAAWRDHGDPALQVRSLGYLAALQEHQSQARQRIADLQRRVGDATAACLERQSRVEALQIHRIDMLKDFMQEELRKEGVRADDEWLTRGQTCNGDARHE